MDRNLNFVTNSGGIVVGVGSLPTSGPVFGSFEGSQNVNYAAYAGETVILREEINELKVMVQELSKRLDISENVEFESSIKYRDIGFDEASEQVEAFFKENPGNQSISKVAEELLIDPFIVYEVFHVLNDEDKINIIE